MKLDLLRKFSHKWYMNFHFANTKIFHPVNLVTSGKWIFILLIQKYFFPRNCKELMSFFRYMHRNTYYSGVKWSRLPFVSLLSNSNTHSLSLHFSAHRACALIIFHFCRFTTIPQHHHIIQSASFICGRNSAASDSTCKGPWDGAADASESHIPLVLFAIAAQVQPAAPRKER